MRSSTRRDCGSGACAAVSVTVETMTTVELIDVEGGTELTLRHELLPLEAIGSHAGGWGSMLDRLASLLSPANQEVARGA